MDHVLLNVLMELMLLMVNVLLVILLVELVPTGLPKHVLHALKDFYYLIQMNVLTNVVQVSSPLQIKVLASHAPKIVVNAHQQLHAQPAQMD
jgi:hypothetical protein